MLRADVGVVELARLGHGQLEHLLGARGVRKIGAGRRSRLPLLHGLLDLLLDLFEIHVEVLEDGGRDSFAFANEAEQDVLGADVLVVQTGRLFARHLQNLPDSISEIVAVHRAYPA